MQSESADRPAPPTVAALLAEARTRLAGSESARADGEILLASLLARPRSYLVAWPDRQVPEDVAARFRGLLARRADGEPVAYLVGHKAFWSLELRVTSDTLVPRPDTELIVERTLAALAGVRDPHLVDLGTGCGAIALSVARERPDAHVVATDLSHAALAVARDNATRLGIDNVRFVEGHWFEPLGGRRFDAIVANPPYIAPGDPALTGDNLRHEPAFALVGRGDEGLGDLREIAMTAGAYLAADGTVLLEHGDTQADAVRAMLRESGFDAIETWPDLAGRDRVTQARRRRYRMPGHDA